jgi:hypothetical protein
MKMKRMSETNTSTLDVLLCSVVRPLDFGLDCPLSFTLDNHVAVHLLTFGSYTYSILQCSEDISSIFNDTGTSVRQIHWRGSQGRPKCGCRCDKHHHYSRDKSESTVHLSVSERRNK